MLIWWINTTNKQTNKHTNCTKADNYLMNYLKKTICCCHMIMWSSYVHLWSPDDHLIIIWLLSDEHLMTIYADHLKNICKGFDYHHIIKKIVCCLLSYDHVIILFSSNVDIMIIYWSLDDHLIIILRICEKDLISIKRLVDAVYHIMIPSFYWSPNKKHTKKQTNCWICYDYLMKDNLRFMWWLFS